MSVGKSPHFYHQNLDPARISFARELNGLTKKELAERINKTPSSITLYEAGKSGISFETFMSLTKALSVSPAFFSKYNPPLPLASLGQCHFRANRRVPQIERTRAFCYARQVFTIFSYLTEKGIHFPKVNLPIYDGSEISERQIERLAVSVRSFMGLGLGPIPNMARLLENAGVRIILLPAKTAKLDGFATWFDDVPCVMIDSDSVASRMQFDYAHELAHLIFDMDSTRRMSLLSGGPTALLPPFLCLRKVFELIALGVIGNLCLCRSKNIGTSLLPPRYIALANWEFCLKTLIKVRRSSVLVREHAYRRKRNLLMPYRLFSIKP